MSDEVNHKRVLLDLIRRRLKEREIQEAQLGIAADPIIKIEISDLRQRIQMLIDEITTLEKSTNATHTLTELATSPQHVAQEILDLLDIAGTTFIAQSRIRNKLVEMLYNQLKIQYGYEYEELFSRYYEQMTPEERHYHATMRGYTSNILASHNKQVLELLKQHNQLIKLIPSLKQLRQHLTIWLAKYEGLFQNSPYMALVYIGVEEGVPFPHGVEQDIRQFLSTQSSGT